MIRYQLVALPDRDMFVKTINSMISHGWLPQGGVALWETATGYLYYQAMMIEEIEEL